MKRGIALVVMTLILGVNAAAQDSYEELKNILNLNATLKTSNTDTALLDSLIENHSLVLFSGTVASRTVINGEEADFLGELELIDGEWQGTDAVTMFKSILLLEGPDYFHAIPQRRSRRTDPREISTNTRFMVIGEAVDKRETSEGVFPVIKVRFLREL